MPPFHKEQLRKLFIGGLNLDTTEESLKDYFSRWGETVDVVVMRFPDTKRSRGFGFVTYENVESVDAVLDAKPHVLDGKEIEPKRAIAKDETAPSGRQEAESSNKIFVGGLASATTEEDVRNCFDKFCEEAGHGKVEDILIMKDRESDRLRGFCFVTFDSKEIVDKVCSVKYFEIRTKTVEVRRAESRMAMMKKEQKDYGYTRRQLEDRRRDMRDSYSDSGRMRGNNYGAGFNQMGNMSGGGGVPFFGGGSGGGSRGGTGSGGFGGGFNMNPMALAGMMSMFMNQMGNMGMGNMGGGGMGMNAMGMNARGTGDGMGSRGGDPGDSFRGSASNSDSFKSNNYSSGGVSTGSTATGDGSLGYGTQNSSVYGDQGAGGMGDMSAYANAMSAMFGGGVNPANVQAALYNAYGGGTGGGSSQMGAYDQSSSSYGPARNTSAPANRGYKPY